MDGFIVSKETKQTWLLEVLSRQGDEKEKCVALSCFLSEYFFSIVFSMLHFSMYNFCHDQVP